MSNKEDIYVEDLPEEYEIDIDENDPFWGLGDPEDEDMGYNPWDDPGLDDDEQAAHNLWLDEKIRRG